MTDQDDSIEHAGFDAGFALHRPKGMEDDRGNQGVRALAMPKPK
jgi:hypothetical protein